MIHDSMRQTIINGKPVLIEIIANPKTGKSISDKDSVSVKFKIEQEPRMPDWECINEENGQPKFFKGIKEAICAVNAAVEAKFRKFISN
jgi:hypothetical protein